MYKMCHYEAAMDKIGEDIPWIKDEQNLPVRTYGGLTRKLFQLDTLFVLAKLLSKIFNLKIRTLVAQTTPFFLFN